MVKHILVGVLASDMFHLDSQPLLDDLVGLGLKLHHRRYVSGDGVSSPDLRVDDAVKGPAQLLDCAQAGKRILVS